MATAAELAILIKARDEASAALGKIESKAGSLGSKLGTALKLGAAAGAAGLVALGAAAIKVGADFDKAYDTIVVGTGATGEELEDLKDTFRNTFKSVPTDMASASTAVADLNTRLGLTGPGLEGMSRRMLELSRITKTDLSTNIQQVSRTFGDWGIAVDDMDYALDKMFVTSQKTGIAVDRLGSMMVQYGAPLRQMGFSFDEAAVLMGKFEKEGVNTELVMGSLRIALGKMAREGEPVIDTFRRTVEQIQNAGSVSEANALALELFGARAGPDMAAAIREGRFAIDDLVAALGDSENAVMKTAEQTMSWQQRLTILKNTLLVALEPALTAVFDALTDAVEKATPYVEDFGEWLGNNLPNAIEKVQQFWTTYGAPTLMTFREGLDSVAEGARLVLDALSSFGNWLINNQPALTAAIAAIGAAFIWTNPLGAALIGAGGIVFALGLFRQSIEDLPEPLLNLRAEIDRNIVRILDFVNACVQVIDVATTLGFEAIPGFESSLDPLQRKITGLRNTAEQDFTDIQQRLDDLDASAALQEANSLATQFEGVHYTFDRLMQKLSIPVGPINVSAAITRLNDLLSAINNVINRLGDLIHTAASAAVTMPGGSYQYGGIVPGPVGQPQLAVVHGGERIIPGGGIVTGGVQNGQVLNISNCEFRVYLPDVRDAEEVGPALARWLGRQQELAARGLA